MKTQKLDATHYKQRVFSYRELEKAVQHLASQFKPRSFERRKLSEFQKDLKSGRKLSERFEKFVGGK